MTALELSQLLLLLGMVLSSFHQVHCSAVHEDYHYDDEDSHHPSSVPVVVTTPVSSNQHDDYIDDYGNDSDVDDDGYYDKANPFTTHTTKKKMAEKRCIFFDDHLSAAATKLRSNKRHDKYGKTLDDFNTSDKGRIEPCETYCFTFWMADPKNKSHVAVSKQGCWLMSSDGQDCEQELCVANSPPRQNNTHFCCCNGDLCNMHFRDDYNPADHTTTTTTTPATMTVGPFHDDSYKNNTIMIALVSVFAVALATVLLYLAYRLCRAPKPTSPQSSLVRTETDQEPILPAFNLDNLKIQDVLVRGRYSEVKKGLLGEKEVVVKIYQPQHRQYYYNEVNAFSQPFMDNENLVKFFGAKEQEDPETCLLQYLVVTEYAPLGSLTGYLKHNTVDWYTLCQMCQGISRGLAHLHTDLQKGPLFKHAIAHRDLNTRNILVNSDLTCMLADLGFSVSMMGSKIIKNGIAENAEQASLADVGTLRYMAPEVFDGAVNLRDCEASLKQIDIYALGLVIWEIASRCMDLYQGTPVPEYQLPFQAEAGIHPTFEEMQILIVKYKTRPKFPDVWKDAHPAVRSLKETIEDCWDTDAEARLTSLCVQERITDMTSLWVQGTKHRGVTPTLNATMNLPEGNSSHGIISSGSAVVANGMTYLPSYVDDGDGNEGDAAAWPPEIELPSPVIINSMRRSGGHGQSRNAPITSDNVTAPLISNVGRLESSGSGDMAEGRVRSWLQDQSVSGSTMDTMLPPTPSEDAQAVPDTSFAPVPPPVKANNVMLAKNKAVILHPCQGRNPTVERNTHKRSDEELTVSGNQLVAPGEQPVENSNRRRGSLGTQSAPPNRSGDSGNFDSGNAIESSSLVQNDVLNQHLSTQPRNPPIPYLQNHVHGDTGGVNSLATHLARPKLANITNNRSSYLRLQGEDGSPRGHMAPVTLGDEGEAKSLKHKLSKLIRPKDLGLKFSQMMFGSKTKKQPNCPTSSGVDVEVASVQNLDHHKNVDQYINSGLEASPVNKNLTQTNPGSVAPVNLEVQVVNGSVVTRTCNDAGNLNISATSNLPNGNLVTAPQARVSATNVMRLGVLANESQEEMPACSLFVKNGGLSTAHNPNILTSSLEQEKAVPLQTLVPSKNAKDYGSMQHVMVNKAYGLDLSDDAMVSNLNWPHTGAAGGETQSHMAANLRPATVSKSNICTDQTSLAMSHNYKSISSLSQSSSNSGNTVNTSHSSASNINCSKLMPSSFNKGLPFGAEGRATEISLEARNLPQDVASAQVMCINPATILDYRNCIHDTKGGNSIMHNIHTDDNNRLCKDGLPSHHLTRHSSRPGKRSASQLPAIRSQPQMSKINGHTGGQNDDEDQFSMLEGATAASPSKIQKSSGGLCQSQSVTDLGWHQHGGSGDSMNESVGTEQGIDCPWQELSKNRNKHRPQSLSLKGHNYNRSRGRSSSSSNSSSLSSLPHPAQSKTSKATSKVAKVPANESVSLGENGPFTLVVPNVTLDKSSPLFQTTDSCGKMPSVVAMAVPSVAVSSARCNNSLSCAGNSTANNTGHSDSKTDSPISNSDNTCQDNSLSTHPSNNKESSDGIGASNQNATDINTTQDQRLDSSEKIRRRIKTPVSFKKGRLSLYDDRLMTQSLGFVPVSSEDDSQDRPRSGLEDNNNNRSNSSGHGDTDPELHISSFDYHKMIKSDSDLVV